MGVKLLYVYECVAEIAAISSAWVGWQELPVLYEDVMGVRLDCWGRVASAGGGANK